MTTIYSIDQVIRNMLQYFSLDGRPGDNKDTVFVPWTNSSSGDIYHLPLDIAAAIEQTRTLVDPQNDLSNDGLELFLDREELNELAECRRVRHQEQCDLLYGALRQAVVKYQESVAEERVEQLLSCAGELSLYDGAALAVADDCAFESGAENIDAGEIKVELDWDYFADEKTQESEMSEVVMHDVGSMGDEMDVD